MTSPQTKYALLGASGAVGQELAKILAAQNLPFRVVGRREEELKKLFSRYGSLVEYVAADLTTPDGAAKAVQGIETLFYLVGVPYNQFEKHPVLSKNVTAAAATAGVKRFVQLSTLYPFGRARTPTVPETHPREPHTFKGRMRKEQEDIVLAADNPNGMRVTLLRAPDFYGGNSDLSFLALVFKAAIEGKTADVLGPINQPHEFVYVPDLAQTLFDLSQKDAAYGETWNLAGFGQISVREFSKRIFAQAGKPMKLRIAPPWMVRIIGFFNPVMREFVEMSYLLTDPLFVDDRKLQKLLPNLHKTSYDEGISRALKMLRGEDR